MCRNVQVIALMCWLIECISGITHLSYYQGQLISEKQRKQQPGKTNQAQVGACC